VQNLSRGGFDLGGGSRGLRAASPPPRRIIEGVRPRQRPEGATPTRQSRAAAAAHEESPCSQEPEEAGAGDCYPAAAGPRENQRRQSSKSQRGTGGGQDVMIPR